MTNKWEALWHALCVWTFINVALIMVAGMFSFIFWDIKYIDMLDIYHYGSIIQRIILIICVITFMWQSTEDKKEE